MEERIDVNVEFFGQFVKIAGKKQEQVSVSPVLKDGIREVRKYLEEAYGINQGFVILVNKEYPIHLRK